MPPKLSVVLGTLDRLAYLMHCLPSIRSSAGGLECEIVVVDGGSTDGTADYLIEQPDVTTIWQRERLGAVAAFNAGFAAASGDYVCNLNDDCVVVRDTLAQACALLDARSAVGQVAIPFSDPRGRPLYRQQHWAEISQRPFDEARTAAIVDYIGLGQPLRKWLYANFGVTRRELGQRLGWWGQDNYHYGGDTELSLRIWEAGYTVEALPGGEIEHYRAMDEARVHNPGAADFIQRWKNFTGPRVNFAGERNSSAD